MDCVWIEYVYLLRTIHTAVLRTLYIRSDICARLRTRLTRYIITTTLSNIAIAIAITISTQCTTERGNDAPL